jgi:hypothetical protein
MQRLLSVLLVSLLLVYASPARGQDAASREYQIKAAFLYKFAKFVKWPPETFASEESPIVIGILGKDPFGPILDQGLKENQAGERKFVIKRVKDAREGVACQILFVSASEQKNFPQILSSLQGAVLTISDVPGFARMGGIINLPSENNKIRVEVNLEQSKKAGLKINSQLLGIATLVETKAGP